jgi:hypothetical protein
VRSDTLVTCDWWYCPTYPFPYGEWIEDVRRPHGDQRREGGLWLYINGGAVTEINDEDLRDDPVDAQRYTYGSAQHRGEGSRLCGRQENGITGNMQGSIGRAYVPLWAGDRWGFWLRSDQRSCRV